jgi:hypothetical protein
LAKTTSWKKEFLEAAKKARVSADKVWTLSDESDLAEGLYLKVETNEEVTARLKWVRPSFTQRIVESGKHHSEGPYIANTLYKGVDIFAPQLTHTWEDLPKWSAPADRKDTP